MAGPHHQPRMNRNQRIQSKSWRSGSQPFTNTSVFDCPCLFLGSERYVPTQAFHSNRHLTWAEKLDLYRGLAEMGSWLRPRQPVAARRGLGIWSRARTERFWSE